MKSPRSDKSDKKKKKVPKTVAVDLGIRGDFVQNNQGDNINPATVTEIFLKWKRVPQYPTMIYLRNPKNVLKKYFLI